MLLWIDGFDSYGTSVAAPSPAGVMGRKYAAIYTENMMVMRAGRLGGYAVDLYNPCYFIPPSLTTDATMVVGAAIMFRTLIENNVAFLKFYDGTLDGFNVRVMSNGELAVYDGASTQKKITAGLGLVANAWYYIEFKVVCGTSGSYDLHVNEVSVLSDTNLNTRASGSSHNYHTTFKFYVSISSTINVMVDDLYCLDGSGTANNDLLGNMRVVTIRPDGDVGTPEFTPDTPGDHFSRVNEAICGDDGNYVEDATSGHKDLYDYAALTAISANIKGVQVNTDCRQTDATAFSLITVCMSGVTESDDSAQSIGSTTYVTKRRILETDPDTADPWDVDGLDASQFGIEVA